MESQKLLPTRSHTIGYSKRQSKALLLSPYKCQVFENEISTYQDEWENRLNALAAFMEQLRESIGLDFQGVVERLGQTKGSQNLQEDSSNSLEN